MSFHQAYLDKLNRKKKYSGMNILFFGRYAPVPRFCWPLNITEKSIALSMKLCMSKTC